MGQKRLEMVQRARRVIGYGGAFPPYEGLIKKFEKAHNFDEAFALWPAKRHRSRLQPTLKLKQAKLYNHRSLAMKEHNRKDHPKA